MTRKMAQEFTPFPDGLKGLLVEYLERKTYGREAHWSPTSSNTPKSITTHELLAGNMLLQLDPPLGIQNPFFEITLSVAVPSENKDLVFGYYFVIRERDALFPRMRDLFDTMLAQPGESYAEQAYNVLKQGLPGF